MLKFCRFPLCLAVLFFINACATVRPEATVFQHDFTSSRVPWTNTGFDDEPGKFTFALFSDLTGGEREGVFELAVEQLRMSGIFDKSGQIPLNGKQLCLEMCNGK